MSRESCTHVNEQHWRHVSSRESARYLAVPSRGLPCLSLLPSTCFAGMWQLLALLHMHGPI
jgi:hypothetical protein